MNVIESFYTLVDGIEQQKGEFSLFALVLTRQLESLRSTTGRQRWTVLAAAPWLKSGRLADVEALEEAISAAGGEQLLEENISNLIVLPNDSRAIQVFETLQGGSPEIVITRRLLLNEDMASDREILEREPRLTLLLPDVLRVRLLRVNAEVGR